MKVPLCKPHFDDDEVRAATEILNSGWLAHGPANKVFEQSLAEYLGVKRVVSLNSCTSALFLALIANDIRGEVLIPSFSFVATANAVVTAGAIPVFVDIEYDTCNIDVEKLEASISSKTKAIIIVHYAGQMCDMKPIQSLAEKHGLLLIEDSAETLGATYEGAQAGSIGIGCFSFFPTKNITTGEGGALATNDEKFADKALALSGHGLIKHTVDRVQGANPWERSAIYPGYNFRMSNLLAALGVAQMKKLDSMNLARQEHARAYDVAFASLPVEIPVIKSNRTHVYQMYTLKVRGSNRDSIVRELNQKEIGASVHFTPAIHQQEYYRGKFDAPAGLEVTEKVAAHILTLPMYPHMTKEERNAVITAVSTTIS